MARKNKNQDSHPHEVPKAICQSEDFLAMLQKVTTQTCNTLFQALKRDCNYESNMDEKHMCNDLDNLNLSLDINKWRLRQHKDSFALSNRLSSKPYSDTSSYHNPSATLDLHNLDRIVQHQLARKRPAEAHVFSLSRPSNNLDWAVVWAQFSPFVFRRNLVLLGAFITTHFVIP